MIRSSLTALALACVPANFAVAQTPVLTVYTYESFMSEWGPGPLVEVAFEEVCGCDLQFASAGDGAGILSRLRLEGARSGADVILGIDTALTAEAVETGLFAPHGIVPERLDLPVAWDDPVFLPYDWGYFAFVHDRTRVPNPPTSLEELAASDLQIVIQDPRSSTPGLGLLMWVQAVYGAEAGAFWERLSPRILTVTQGWSEAYGMFLENEADMVLSYTTSPAYHLIAENDDTKAAAAFSDGHYMQIEVAGLVASSDQPELGRAFLEFMMSPAFQSTIPETNWMYPAVLPPSGLPDGFDTLVTPQKALLLPPEEVRAIKAEAVETWRAALAR